MKKVSMLDFRLDAEKIIAQVQRGQPIILTRRGKPVARLEPIVDPVIDSNDSFYMLSNLSDGKGKSLTNSEIDEIVYGQ